MGRKVFISYKYSDDSVKRLDRTPKNVNTTARHYVDELQEKLDKEYHINKGEKDDEDLTNFKNETIKSKLRDKIYDSIVTIVLISPNMKENWKSESDQWIPWEISYSLREVTRNDRTSRRNGMLAVVLPDQSGSYTYMLEPRNCCEKKCITWHIEKLFNILSINMFNKIEKENIDCKKNEKVYSGYFSYIHLIRWDYFIGNLSYWIEQTILLQQNQKQYNIHVNV